jgi:hypothetical protein
MNNPAAVAIVARTTALWKPAGGTANSSDLFSLLHLGAGRLYGAGSFFD